ncbi:hypothetical protein IWX90DRAFT_441008 [Phyllosticta citrichinensis]|uniref:Pentatricopeptide repeat-containing protein n=1 Tax=Phyllosticta citrichinensis TaxID=1130410 RepID=A0ABR1XLN3_9PEZI
MLERAPTYLENGGRYFLRASATPSVRGSRALHPPFGHHDSVSQPSTHLQHSPEKSSPRKNGSHREESNTATDAHLEDGHGSFLYFLYPNRTLTLMRRFDNSSRGEWKLHPLSIPTVGRRHYSSKPSSKEGPKVTNSKAEDVGENNLAKVRAETNQEKIEQREDTQVESALGHTESERNAVDMKGAADKPDEDYAFDQQDGNIGSDMDALELDSMNSKKSRTEAQPVDEPVNGSKEGKRLKIFDVIEATVQSHDKPEAISKLMDYYSDISIDEESRNVLPQAIWRLWSALTTNQKTPKLATAILQHLGSIRPFLRTHAERIIEVFESLPHDCKVGESYDSAILAYLTIHGPGKAALIYFEGVSEADSKEVRFDFLGHGLIPVRVSSDKLRPNTPEHLISRAIADGEWQLVIDVITTAEQFGTIDWVIVARDLDACNHLAMLLIRLRQLQRLGAKPTESERQFRLLATELARQSIAQKTASWSSESRQAELWRLLLKVKQSGYVFPDHQAEMHAFALETILHAKEITKFSHLPPIVFRLYNTYVTAILEARDRADRKPPLIRRSTFVCMLHGFLRHPKLPPKQTVDTGVVFYHYKLIVGRPTVSMISLLMHYHANMGDDRKVKAYFRELVTYHKGKIRENRAIFRSMFFALSRKGDVAGAEELIKYMKEEFDLTPDSQSWNSVLKAHVRNQDLGGAWERLKQMMKVTKLDGNSFRIILSSLANRGDVDAVKEIFDMISELDPVILRDARTVLFLVLAYVKSGDLHSAERFAMQLQDLKAEGQLEGDTVVFWNTIATEYARERDIQAVQRIMAYMTEHGIPYDAHTYAALLLALVSIHQTDVAYKILRTVISKEPVERLSLHYGIVMAGYINQRRYWKVWYVDRFRQHQRVPATFSTRSALVQAVLFNESKTNRETGEPDKFEKTERMAIGQLNILEPWEVSKEIQVNTKFTPINQLQDSYLDVLILTFGQKGMFDMSQKMFDLYAKRNDIDFSDPEKTPPMRMLVALMHNFLKAEQYAEVEQCWRLAKEQADALSQLRPANVASEFASQEDTSKQKAASRRKIITNALSVYMMSLKQQDRVEDIQKVVHSVLSEGYEMGNSLWNTYIQLLARSGRIAHAFSLTETELMPQWPGWKNPKYANRKRYDRGWQYLYVSPLRQGPGAKLPTYRTMVFLAAALKYVRRAEAIGTGGGTVVTEEFLEKRAPVTVKAARSMPRVDDALQTMYLGDV